VVQGQDLRVRGVVLTGNKSMKRRREYKLDWTLTTHCPGCGTQLGIRATILIGDPDYVRKQKEYMLGQIEAVKGKCPSCRKPQDPVPMAWVTAISALI
jgi:hypothetical protein